jgi:hypothetical protein
MKKTTMIIFLILTLLLPASLSFGQKGAIPEVTQSQFWTAPDDLRDVRYCEVITAFRKRLTLKIEVYNTIGCNYCPADLWDKLDAEAMAETYDAQAVKLNGPRYLVMNEMTAGDATATGKIADFGGIEMKLVAVLETKLRKGSGGENFYTDNEVQRSNSLSYRAGNMVYELTSPEGDVYRMLSYSQTVDPMLSSEALETLGNRLNLPEGWSYQARVLTADSALVSEGVAYVMNDEFLNTYQKVILP